uniref:Uncharacterized protein n=1 Tax=Salmonella phage PMBT27 TaxID=3137285 RepID=A0AAU8BWN8_9VIRU
MTQSKTSWKIIQKINKSNPDQLRSGFFITCFLLKILV